MLTSFSSSAPANVMIMGEHSVVYGYPALVAALPPRITIHWQARADREIHIHSALANFSTSLDQLADHPKLRFVLAAIRAFADQLKQGWDLTIDSEFPADWGLGSSAAVLAATIVGLEKITQNDLSTWQKFEIGHRCILAIQGRGSGADLAASLTGGLVYFEPGAQRINRLEQTLDLCLIYSGYKTPTAEVLAQVAAAWQDRPQQRDALYHAMANITKQAYQALQHNQQNDFYRAVQHYQQLMQQLGVSDTTLDTIISRLQQQTTAAKISGSGLGDCVLAFGHLDKLEPYALLNTQISQRGAECD